MVEPVGKLLDQIVINDKAEKENEYNSDNQPHTRKIVGTENSFEWWFKNVIENAKEPENNGNTKRNWRKRKESSFKNLSHVMEYVERRIFVAMEMMRAMILERVGGPLLLQNFELPEAGAGQVLIKVHACAICRTDLHIIDGELPAPHLPLILGHQIVGTALSGRYKDQIVGVPWLGKTCGHCLYCDESQENLCDYAEFTGFSRNGGYADYCVAYEDFLLPIPPRISPIHAAPLLCGGAIGYRALKMIDDAETIGFYGFGASAHLLIQIARYQNRKVYAFTRKGDHKKQQEALSLGATWAGDSETAPPELLDAAILFAAAGELVPKALKAVRKGGTVVCAEIEMSAIPSFPYKILWGERILRSVANLTREDGKELLALAAKIPIHTQVASFPLEQANEAIEATRSGSSLGVSVLTI